MTVERSLRNCMKCFSNVDTTRSSCSNRGPDGRVCLWRSTGLGIGAARVSRRVDLSGPRPLSRVRPRRRPTLGDPPSATKLTNQPTWTAGVCTCSFPARTDPVCMRGDERGLRERRGRQARLGSLGSRLLSLTSRTDGPSSAFNADFLPSLALVPFPLVALPHRHLLSRPVTVLRSSTVPPRHHAFFPARRAPPRFRRPRPGHRDQPQR